MSMVYVSIDTSSVLSTFHMSIDDIFASTPVYTIKRFETGDSTLTFSQASYTSETFFYAVGHFIPYYN